MAKDSKGSFLSRLKLNKKFLLMYIFCVIMPLVITDAILFKSVFDAEISNQSNYRETAIEAYSGKLESLLQYDSTLASAIDLNRTLHQVQCLEKDVLINIGSVYGFYIVIFLIEILINRDT